MSDAPSDLNRLRRLIHGYGSVLVAYSGGVDSAVVLRVAHDELGERALGCIGNSPAYPETELAYALAMANEQGLAVRVVETTEFLDPDYAANGGDRCFHCRKHLFHRLRQLADTLGFLCIADGVHTDDLSDHIGGMAAAREQQVHSPLLEAGLGKTQVRAIAAHLGLRAWNKPAMACLASRIPRRTPVTISLLRQLNEAEQRLTAMGFHDFRVRHHGNLARIELTEIDFAPAIRCHEEIVSALREVGYLHVTLDLSPRTDQSAAAQPHNTNRSDRTPVELFLRFCAEIKNFGERLARFRGFRRQRRLGDSL